MKTRRFNYHGYPLTESYFNAMLNRGHTEGSADYYARLVKKVESYMIICGISDINEEVANSCSPTMRPRRSTRRKHLRPWLASGRCRKPC